MQGAGEGTGSLQVEEEEAAAEEVLSDVTVIVLD